MREISVTDLAAWQNDSQREAPLLLDVRETWEFAICHINGSLLIPMPLIPIRLAEIADERPIVVICHHGVRSLQVARYLHNNGFDDVMSLAGGVDAWATYIDPSLAHY